MIFQRRFNARQIQQLILDGWIVNGDREYAYRNGERIDPTIYRQLLEERSELLKAPPPR